MTFYFLCVAQSEEDLWDVLGGSSLSLCMYADSWPMTLTPQMEYQVMSGKNPLAGKYYATFFLHSTSIFNHTLTDVDNFTSIFCQAE
jgi:hypothetical protein